MRSKKEDPNSKRADDEHRSSSRSRRLCKEKQRFCRQREGGRETEKHTKQGLCCVHSEEEEEDCSCCCLREYILSCKSASFCLCTSARFCFVCAKALSSSIDFLGFGQQQPSISGLFVLLEICCGELVSLLDD